MNLLVRYASIDIVPRLVTIDRTSLLHIYSALIADHSPVCILLSLWFFVLYRVSVLDPW